MSFPRPHNRPSPNRHIPFPPVLLSSDRRCPPHHVWFYPTPWLVLTTGGGILSPLSVLLPMWLEELSVWCCFLFPFCVVSAPSPQASGVLSLLSPPRLRSCVVLPNPLACTYYRGWYSRYDISEKSRCGSRARCLSVPLQFFILFRPRTVIS